MLEGKSHPFGRATNKKIKNKNKLYTNYALQQQPTISLPHILFLRRATTTAAIEILRARVRHGVVPAEADEERDHDSQHGVQPPNIIAQKQEEQARCGDQAKQQ